MSGMLDDYAGAASTPDVAVHETAAELCDAVARNLVDELAAAQARNGLASVVLTGGRTGIAVLERVRANPRIRNVDWSAVRIFWSDERFVPAGHPDRNEAQARDALLDHVPVDPRLVYPMGASDDPYGTDSATAAAAYSDLLRRMERPDCPLFDVCLLGVGEDGHVASLFPGHPASEEPLLAAVSVRDSPKPPSERISLTLGTIRSSAEVWLVTTGAAKTAAVADAFRGNTDFPASRAVGIERTIWHLDREAAGGL